jgi:predicted PurR-regulated permease PerM
VVGERAILDQPHRTSAAWDSEASPRRRAWRAVDFAATILAVLAIFYTLYFARAVLFPLVLAFVFGLLLRPVVRRLKRLYVPEAIGAAAVVLLVLGVLLFGGMTLVAPASQWIEDLPRNLEQASVRLKPLQRPLAKIQHKIDAASQQVAVIASPAEAPAAAPPGPAEAPEKPPRQLVEIRQPSLATTVLNTTGSFLAGAAMTIIMLYFMLALGETTLRKVVEVLPTFRDKRSAVELVTSIEHGISSYLVTVTVINIGLGAAIGTALWLIGLPNAILWGAMAACLNYVPYAGAIVGMTIVFFASLLTFNTIGHALLAPLAYFTINAIEGNFVTPMVLGRSMSLNPIIVFLSLVFGGWMWGVGGALLSVPLLAIAKITCEHFDRTKPIATLLSQ